MTRGTTGDVDYYRLAAQLWQAKVTIASIIMSAALLGGIAYYVSPRIYESEVIIHPVNQSSYSEYGDLMARITTPRTDRTGGENADVAFSPFPYTPNLLFEEFISSLQSTDHLVEAAKESGIAMSEAASLTFARSVRFTRPTDRMPGFRMRVRAEDPDALDRFMALGLGNAQSVVAARIRAAVLSKIETINGMQVDAIAALKVEVEARKNQQQQSRADQIAILSEQVEIADALGIRNPASTLELISREPDASGSVKVIASPLPLYLQGSVALREQIALLKARTDDAPFDESLRGLERQILVLERQVAADRSKIVLDASPLNDPATAPIADFSVLASSAVKVFPSCTVFAAVSVLLGLLIGCIVALFRENSRQSRLHTQPIATQ